MGVVNCKEIKQNIESEVRNRINYHLKNNFRKPRLDIILANNDIASKKYIQYKLNACERVGIDTKLHNLYPLKNKNELFKKIEYLNNNFLVDGFIVQFPISLNIRKSEVLSKLNPYKDVDGLSPVNFGFVSYNLFDNHVTACTPKGIIYLIDYLGIDVKGMNIVIINSSKIVGRPLANILLSRKATVTVCNRYTKDVAFFTRNADIIVTATGCANLIKSEMIKKEAIIFDVGITKDKNNNICGDVDFQDTWKKCKYITSVPGGVGLLTVAMIIKNILFLYEKNYIERNKKR